MCHMCQMISCLVTEYGRVLAKDGINSHSELARIFKVKGDKVLKYKFNLRERRLVQDFDINKAPFEAKKYHDMAAQSFFDKCAGTPELLIAFVERGNWDEKVLSGLLTNEAWEKYNDLFYNKAFKEYTMNIDKVWEEFGAMPKECNASRDKACIKVEAASKKAQSKFNMAPIQIWIDLFRIPQNRIEAWR